MDTIDEQDVAQGWPVPDANSHKYSRGVVGLDTGSAHYPGAALLGIAGALNSGAGMVRYLGEAPRDLVIGCFPSVVVADGRVQAVVVGSGWGDVQLDARMAAAVEHGVPLVVDADALTVLPPDLPENSLLTPHAGELARLLGVEREEVESDPVRHAREASRRVGAVVLLKGGAQYVATPQGVVVRAVPGPGWTAQAGSGDVLAGVCGTLLAAGLPADRAGLLAASLQAMTAARFPGPHPPDHLAGLFPEVIGGFVGRESR